MTTATNVRRVAGRDVVPGHHLWMQAGAQEWAGPRITGTYYCDETDEIELRTWNGGVCYVRPSDRLWIADHTNPWGDS